MGKPDCSTVIRSIKGASPDAGAQEACLVMIYGPSLGLRIGLESGDFSIGRDPSCDLELEAEEISRHHCLITVEDGAARLMDLESTNGTQLNDRDAPANEYINLRTGDRLQIGGAIFKYLDGSDLEAQYHEEIHRTAIIDGLTLSYNRRYLDTFLQREFSRSRRHGRSLCFLIIDIDEFKKVNDAHGHVAGDHVLRQVSVGLCNGVRAEECFGRYGGEEFAVVAPETTLESARLFAERLRGEVEALMIQHDGTGIEVTVSIGIAQLDSTMIEPRHLIEAADRNLYLAKQAGRNRVEG